MLLQEHHHGAGAPSPIALAGDPGSAAAAATDRPGPSPETLLGLAVAHLRKGEFGLALHRLNEALRERPQLAEVQHVAGVTLLAINRPDEAVLRFETALGLKPGVAEFHRNAGIAHVAAKRPLKAIAHFERALAIAPAEATSHHGLGFALAALGRHEEAIARLRVALAAAPSLAAAHNDLGVSLQALGRQGEALAAYRRATALSPRFATAHHNLGIALEEAGEFDEARLSLEAAIALEPRKAQHYYGLASLHRFVADDPKLRAMQVLAGDITTLPMAEQVDLRFALYKACADLDRHEEAFGHLTAGNALKRANIAYDELATSRLFAALRATFTAELMQRMRGCGHGAAEPVFVIGMPRSGTTLVEQILASHPEVFGAGEIKTFEQTLDAMRGAAPDLPPFPELVSSLSGEALGSLGAAYAARIKTLAPQASRIVNKMPANFLFAGLIRLALPKARIIHIRRDPLDTCFSLFSTRFVEGQAHSYDLAELGRYYRNYARLIEHWREVMPGNMLELDYEELVADFETQARRIIAHCGLSWQAGCLEFHKTRRMLRTASSVQARQPLYRSAIGRWRNYATELRPLIEAIEGALAGGSAVQREAFHDLVDLASFGMEREADEIERVRRDARDSGAIVDIVAGRKERSRIDRRVEAATGCSLQDEAELRPIGRKDEHRLADEPPIGLARGVDIALAREFRV
jgi:Flp pilus assembly protein TadD